MASRKKDFAIFRSIGTNKSALAKMVVLEQVIMNMIGFVITMIGFYSCNTDLVILEHCLTI